jgi:hypothetical protein
MLESIIYTCFTSIEDPRDITFLKKNIYSIQDKDILLSILYILVGKVMRQADSHPAGNSVSNRQDLFKEITQTLKSMDNQLAYAWFGYIFNSNKGSEKQKRCFPTAWKASYYLTQQELNELEQIIKK